MAGAVFYEDAFRVWELLDRWNHMGPPDPDSVCDLFDRDPSTAKFVGLHGRTFVHKCLEHHGFRHLRLLECLIDAYPESLYREDEQGLLPIHIALLALEKNHASVVELLLRKSGPEVLLHQDERTGGLPLHTACRSTFARTLPVLRQLVEAFPDALQHRDNAGLCPLHHALEQESPRRMDGRPQGRAEVSYPDAVQYLIRSCPTVLQETIPGADGFLPLHRAVLCPVTSLRTIELLIEAFPRALRVQDCRHRRTPLVLACRDEDVTLSTVYSLVRQWPEQIASMQASAVFETSKFNGEVLISSVASASASIDMVQEWTKCYSTSELMDGDSYGRLPLHYAAVSRSKDAFEIVRHIIQLAPESLRHADKHGRYPLHYAAVSPLLASILAQAQVQSEASLSSAQSHLLTASGLYRNNVVLTSGRGAYTDIQGDGDNDDSGNDPNEIALQILEYVADEYPEALIAKDCDGRVPWHYAEYADTRRGELLLERTIELDPGLDYYLVPEDEVRWDIVQICHGADTAGY